MIPFDSGGASSGSGIGSVIGSIDLAGAFGEIMTSVGGLVTSILPIGVGIMLVFAVPRIVRRIVSAFV